VTVFTPDTIKTSFLGRAVSIAWDALPRTLPTIVFAPLIIFGGLVIGIRMPFLGLPVALVAAGALLGWATAAVVRSALRSSDMELRGIRPGWSVALCGALCGAIAGIALEVMIAAGLASDRGAPALFTAPAGGVAGGLLVFVAVCTPRFIFDFAMTNPLVDAVLGAGRAVVAKPASTVSCFIITVGTVASGAVWGPIGLGCALIVCPALFIVTMQQTPKKVPAQ